MIKKLLLSSIIALTMTLAFVDAADAHVHIEPESAPAGSFQTLTFSVPNEEADANTVKVEIEIPTDQPIKQLTPSPVAGWQDTVSQVKVGDSAAVSRVTWTATNGGVPPEQSVKFSFNAGPLPSQASSVIFKTLQTYSNGKVVRWISPMRDDGSEPDDVAPVLQLTDSVTTTPAAPTTTATSTSVTVPTATAVNQSDGDNNAKVLTIVGIVALVAALAALGAFVVRRKRTRS